MACHKRLLNLFRDCECLPQKKIYFMTSALVVTRGKFSKPYETFHLNASLYIDLALIASLDLLKEDIFPRLLLAVTHQ